ncbi:hypothetical protein EV356DRAFT_346830 [Viridothelium virens]|uniref:Uncharacterized protein n=1 Tax=Viridothelium virens TaxID=1048519 RepID=A0A6A6GX07_VIRVR|nr:hypothetical protein EV356DRAFT_346830 [Viridothelium virens]
MESAKYGVRSISVQLRGIALFSDLSCSRSTLTFLFLDSAYQAWFYWFLHVAAKRNHAPMSGRVCRKTHSIVLSQGSHTRPRPLFAHSAFSPSNGKSKPSSPICQFLFLQYTRSCPFLDLLLGDEELAGHRPPWLSQEWLPPSLSYVRSTITVFPSPVSPRGLSQVSKSVHKGAAAVFFLGKLLSRLNF